MKNCTCNKEDGIHEWDCAIEVEKRNNLESSKLLNRMAPFFGLEKKKESHGYRWAEKSASPKHRRTKRAVDFAGTCRVVNHFYVEGVCAHCGKPEPQSH